jgi:hypothetical protein
VSSGIGCECSSERSPALGRRDCRGTVFRRTGKSVPESLLMILMFCRSGPIHVGMGQETAVLGRVGKGLDSVSAVWARGACWPLLVVSLLTTYVETSCFAASTFKLVDGELQHR